MLNYSGNSSQKNKIKKTLEITDDRLLSGIVHILKANGNTVGTGFVTHDGFIVTCAHVVSLAGAVPGEMVNVELHVTKKCQRATVNKEYWNKPEAEDISVLRSKSAIPSEASPLPLGSSSWAEKKTFRIFGFSTIKSTEGLPGKCEVLRDITNENNCPVLTMPATKSLSALRSTDLG